MGLLDRLFVKNSSDKTLIPSLKVSDQADNNELPENGYDLISIEFENRTNEIKTLWIEPTCVEFHLDRHSEFMLLAKDDTYRIQINDDYITIYLQYTFDLQLYKRPTSEDIPNPNEWELVEDYFDVFI
jgi:hypothetical protein